MKKDARGCFETFLARLDEEILEVEASQEQARVGGRWRQYDVLDGQKTGLMQVKRWLKETQTYIPDLHKTL